MKKVHLALVIALALVSFSLTTAPLASAAPQVIQLKMQSWGSATYPTRIATENMIKKLNATGRFAIKYFPQQSLFPAKEVADGLRRGVLDVGESGVGYHLDRFGLVGEVQWMPRNFTFEKFRDHYRDPGSYFDFNKPYFDKLGLKLLVDFHAPASILCSTKPVKTIDDVKGLMIRDVGTMKPWFKLLGITPVNINVNELYEGFSRGMIHGAITSSSAYMANKWYEVAKYVADFEWFLPGTTLMMNKAVYEAWPADVKAIFDQAILEAEKEMFAIAKEQDDDDVKSMTAKGAIITKTSPADQQKFDRLIQPYFDSLGEKYGQQWTEFVKIQKTLK